MVDIVPDHVKERLSLLLARDNHRRDPYLVGELVFHQSSAQDAARMACEFVDNNWVSKEYFTCGCTQCAIDGEWNNFSLRQHCLHDYEHAIHSALENRGRCTIL